MTPEDTARIEIFITRWEKSGGNERANYQMFFSELCDALGVKRPDAKGSVVGDPFRFDKDLTIYHPNGKISPGYIDFYKADHFLIEAKQGSELSGKGTAKRGTSGETPVQGMIEGTEVETEPEPAIAPVEQQKFPKAFKDQLAAVRNLLRTQGGDWTIEQIAAQFKGGSRQKQTILTCLESLEALGIIARHGEDERDRWYLAELQKAS